MLGYVETVAISILLLACCYVLPSYVETETSIHTPEMERENLKQAATLQKWRDKVWNKDETR